MERHWIALKGIVILGMFCLGASAGFAFGIVSTTTDTQTATLTVTDTATAVSTSTATQTLQRTVGFGSLSFHKPQFGQVVSGSTTEAQTTAPAPVNTAPVAQSSETGGNRFTAMKFQTLSFGKQASTAPTGSSDPNS